MRLIDADLLEAEYIKSMSNDTHHTATASQIHMQEHNHILHLLEKAPTVDVVTEERCREIATEMKAKFVSEALKQLFEKLYDDAFYIQERFPPFFATFNNTAVVRMSTVAAEIKKMGVALDE